MNIVVVGGAAVAAVGFATAMGWYRARVNGPFEPTNWVWSRGLGLLCDVNGGVDFVKRQLGGRPPLRFDPSAFANIREGDLVWVRHIALPQLVAEVLPHVRNRFALVTGDEDWSIPSDFVDSRRITECEQVACWFTQNYDGSDDSGKISPIPIGLDFHTISNRRKWGHWPATPTQQEAELASLVARMPPASERLLLAHADFHFNKHKQKLRGDTRDDVETLLRDNRQVVFQDKKVRRMDLWETKTRYAFVVSPHGNGLDCHRTWESLVLGNIPIVKRSPLDPLYDGLPVVIVDDWREITEQSLRSWLDLHAEAFSRPSVQERLTNRYWIEHMRRKLKATLEGE